MVKNHPVKLSKICISDILSFHVFEIFENQKRLNENKKLAILINISNLIKHPQVVKIDKRNIFF